MSIINDSDLDTPLTVDADPFTSTIDFCSFGYLIIQVLRGSVDIDEFLLTYRSFSSAQNVLQALIRPGESDSIGPEEKRAMSLRIFNILKKWIDPNKGYSYHFFASAECPKIALQFLAAQAKTTIVAEALRTKLEKQVADLAIPEPLKPLVTYIPPAKGISIADLDADEITKQFTLMDWELWVAIKPHEWFDWTKKKWSEVPNSPPSTKNLNKGASGSLGP